MNTINIIICIIFILFVLFCIYLFLDIKKIRKKENPSEVDKTFMFFPDLNKDNFKSFYISFFRILSHQYLINELNFKERSPDKINITCKKGERKINTINIIFFENKAYIRSIDNVLDISRILYCIEFKNNSFEANFKKSKQIYSDTFI